jgi:Ca-activated chloride channel family protein
VQAHGNTALHDALVSSLYMFRGFRGQRALVLISDGDDSASTTAFRQALEYARRSGVAIYAVGIDVDRFSWSIRRKLSVLAAETGGRAFFVRQAAELAAIYRQIDVELRTRYLVAYISDAPAGAAAFRTVEVKLGDATLRARTIRGYYP